MGTSKPIVVTQAELKKRLHYDPASGIFTWLKPLSTKLCPGMRAGCIKWCGDMTRRHATPGRSIQVGGQHCFEHRLAFLYMTGSVPDNIEHINDNYSDNRWANLRAVVPSWRSPFDRAGNPVNERVLITVPVGDKTKQVSVCANCHLQRRHMPDCIYYKQLPCKRCGGDGPFRQQKDVYGNSVVKRICRRCEAKAQAERHKEWRAAVVKDNCLRNRHKWITHSGGDHRECCYCDVIMSVPKPEKAIKVQAIIWPREDSTAFWKDWLRRYGS